MIKILSFEAEDRPVETTPLTLQYDLSRQLLAELASAPERDASAIEEVMSQLDKAHAALKVHYAERRGG